MWWKGWLLLPAAGLLLAGRDEEEGQGAGGPREEPEDVLLREL